MRVTRSGFYAWRRRPESTHTRRTASACWCGVVCRSRRTYGPRVWKDLTDRHHVSRKRVMRLMQAEGLKGRVRRRYRSTTMSDHDQPVPANVLNQEFSADAPDQRWVADTTELTIGSSSRLFLAAILDLFSRFVVGWAVSAANDRHLVLKRSRWR
jgi:transposase InsO family protein